MSVQSEIERINNNVASTYSALAEMGADIPTEQNTDNLPRTANSIKAVRYDAVQSLTDSQKKQARDNIGSMASPTTAKVGQTIVVKSVDSNGRPTEWQAVDMTSGGASSWNDLTDKPFSAETGTGVIMPLQVILADPSSGAQLEYIEFKLGETYTVSYNGVDYNTIAVAASAMGDNAIAIGNFGALTGGEDTGEPFLIASVTVDSDSLTRFMPLDGSTAPVVGINGRTVIYEKLDSNYLDLKWKPINEKPSTEIYESDIVVTTKVGEAARRSLFHGEEMLLYDIAIVTVDGKEYECEIQKNIGGKELVIGNLYILDNSSKNTGEPFLIIENNNSTQAFFYHAIAGTHTFDIRVCKSVKMPESFLPISNKLQIVSIDNPGTIMEITVKSDGTISAVERKY